MTTKSICEIAKIMYKNNKQKYKGIARGIFIAILLLIFASYLIFGFNIGVKKSLNKSKDVCSFYINYEEENKDEVIDALNKHSLNNKISYKLFSSVVNSFGNDKATFKIADKNLNYNLDRISLCLYDTSKLYFAEEEQLLFSNNESFILKGGFINNQNEIIISDKLINDYDLDIDKILNTNLSFSYKNSVLDNYKIVGIYNSKIYNCPSRFGNNDPLFWISNINFECGYINNDIIMLDDANTCLAKYKNVSLELTNLANVVLTNFLHDYNSYRPLLAIVSNLLLVFGLAVLIISVLNIINSLLYFYKLRQPFIGMLKAMGGTSYDVFRLNYWELLLIVKKPLILSVIISFSLCLIMSLVMNKIINNYEKNGLDIMLKLDFLMYPVSLILVVTPLLIFMFFITFVIYKANNRSIIFDLKENN